MPSGAPYMAAPREQVLDLWAGPGDSLHSYIDTQALKQMAASSVADLSNTIASTVNEHRAGDAALTHAGCDSRNAIGERPILTFAPGPAHG